MTRTYVRLPHCGLSAVLTAMGLMCVSAAQAFNPPVDAAGPLTVKIEGPAVVSQVETPTAVRVVLENKSDVTIAGAVELKLIDAWRAEPAGPVRFAVDAKSAATLPFTIRAGRGAHDALYPIHALARFEAGGKSHVAHPILIFAVKRATASASKPSESAAAVGNGLAWQPFPVAAEGQLALWQVPMRRSVLEVFGEKPLVMPVGWQGMESRSRGVCEIRKTTAASVSREAIVMHPPWYEGRAGTIFCEFPLALPKTTPLRLAFANAMQPEGHSDGVTFRVRVLPLDAPVGQFGDVLFQRHIEAKTWQAAEVDLSRFAGRSVRIQLESHPGPKHDTGWDLSYWAEPTLLVGKPAAAPPFPPVSEEGSHVLGTIQRADLQCEVRIWPGKRGLLDSVVRFASGEKKLAFRGFQVRVLGSQLEDPRSPITLEQVRQEWPVDLHGCQVRHHFHSLLGNFDVVGRLEIAQGMWATFRLENAPPPRPWQAVQLEDVATGAWSQTARQVYAGDGNVIRQPGPFELHFDGHALSTSFVGIDFDDGMSLIQGVDVPPSVFSVQPATRHYALHAADDCQFTFIPAQNVWEGARAWHDTNGLQAAGGVRTAAGRFVFDLWGGHYHASGEALRRAFRYGLTHSMVVWHNWQRWGYDYRLPEIYPPNPQFGTVEQMHGLIEVCKRAGVPFALHDNYIDFYPDADGFSYEKAIAFDGKDQPTRGWLNEGRGAQAYRFRADCIEQFLRPNIALLLQHLRPSAYFIDVWSSASPYTYWTSEGRFFTKLYTRDVWRKQFAWIRAQMSGTGPQISESGHDQLIGYLDGAQTNHSRVEPPRPGGQSYFVWPIDCGDAERTPWFDAAHHDRFVLHGAGYPSRYEGGLDARAHGIYSDDYLSTEVLTGHPAMVSSPFGRDVVRMYWLTSDLMRGLALRRIESVEYAGGNLHRQHVRWSGGGEAWVNRDQTDWDVDGIVLPPYGFLARVPVEHGAIEATICRRDGVITESASSSDRLYVNGRQTSPGKASNFDAVTTCGACRLAPDGRSLVVTPLPESAGPAFTVAVSWAKLPWKLLQPTHVQAINEEGKVLSTQVVATDEYGDVMLTCEPGVFQYRWVRQ